MEALIPYGASDFPASATRPLRAGLYQGVHLECLEENLEQLREFFETIFAERNEIILVNWGATVKQGHGYIILEWEECEVDQMFIDMLRTQEVFLDFSLYIRDEEE